MKRYLSVSAAAIAAVTMFGSAALADPGDTLSETLGTEINALLDAYEDGSFTNFAVNNNTIDGSVTAEAEQFATATDTLDEFSETGNSNAFDRSEFQDITVINQTLGAVKTTAVGAINDGTIKTTSESANFDLEGSFTDSGSSSAASNTTSSAMAEYTGLELAVDYSYEGVPDITGTNFAFNNAPIDGSVDLTGLGANGVATTVAGAINTGVIEVGIE
jgi:hypothetical protein